MLKNPLRAQNKLHVSHRKVIEYIKKNGKATRVEIAKATELSNQSLTRLSKDLIKLNIICEDSKTVGQRGQPATHLSLQSGVFACIGVIFDLDQIIVVADDLSGKPIKRFQQKGQFMNASLAIKTSKELLNQIFAELPDNQEVLGIGISVSGFFINTQGNICSRQDPQGWSKIDWQETFSAHYDCPCYVENDGSTAAIGYSLSQQGSKLQSFFLILLTHGIGGGFIYDKSIIRGQFGNAGEIAALFSSNENAIRPTLDSLYHYLAKSWQKEVTYEKILDAFEKKDVSLTSWLTSCIDSMNVPLSSIQSLFDPEAIVFSGPLPLNIRQYLADKVSLSGPSFGDISTPAPKLIIDKSSDILEIGATAIPAFYFFSKTS